MSIQAFLNEFDKRLHKTKSYGTVQSDNILAYCLLKSADSSNNHEELIKATIPNEGPVKEKLIPTKNEEVIKAEDTFLIENFSQTTIEGFIQNKNTILSDQQIASKHMIRNWILITVEIITATIIEEIISIDTTNNNLK